MKIFFSILLSGIILNAGAQEKITKYYDANWEPASRDNATYHADFTKDGSLYQCISHILKTNRITGKSTYKDTNFLSAPIGLQVLYYDNGSISDSSFFVDGGIKYSYHYYPNKQLAVYYYVPVGKTEGVAEGFDEDGSRLKNYIFMKEAEFKGGSNAWQEYLIKSFKKLDININNKNDTTLKMVVQFIVDKDGYVTRPKVKESSGFKAFDNAVLGVISDSPKWNNAIQYNRPVNAYQLQPITYIVPAQKKK
jgi:TonB family protein